MRPELRGRFLFCGADALLDSFDGPMRTERFPPRPFNADALWEEIAAVVDHRGRRTS